MRAPPTETSTVKVDEHGQTLVNTATPFAPTFTAASALLLLRSPDAQPQTVLTHIARPVEALQVVLKNLVDVDTTRVRIEELHATGTNLRGLDILIRLRERLRSSPTQFTDRRLCEGNPQKLAHVRLCWIDFAMDAAGGCLNGQTVMLRRAAVIGRWMGGHRSS